jgi:hypothetical protein
MAFEVVKAMQAEGLDWGEGYRPLGRQALQEIIEDQMAAAVDRHLDQLEAEDAADLRNGYYRRHLLTELGDIELNVPPDPPLQPDRGYSRLCAAHAGDRPGHPRRLHARPVDAQGGRDVAGLARTIGEPQYGEPGCQDARCRGGRLPSPAAAQSLPSADARRRRTFPQDRRRHPAQAGSRRFGAAPRRQKEIIDFRLAASESAAEWEKFLADLYRRGLTGEGLDMICVDGGCGLLAALPTIFPGIAVQRCWAHKIRNVLDKVKTADQPAVKRALHKIMNAPNAARCGILDRPHRRERRDRGRARREGADAVALPPIQSWRSYRSGRRPPRRGSLTHSPAFRLADTNSPSSGRGRFPWRSRTSSWLPQPK